MSDKAFAIAMANTIPKGPKGDPGDISSVNGKTGSAVVLDSGDLGYDDSETYSSGSVGAAVSQLKSHSENLFSEFSDILGYQTDITDRFVFTDGKGVRYNSYGALYDNAYASYSNFVDVSEFDHLLITMRHVVSATNAGLAFYKAKEAVSGSFVRGIQEGYGGVSEATSLKLYCQVVENSKYIRLTWYPSTNAQFGDFQCIGIKAGKYAQTENLAKANQYVTGVVDYWGDDLYIAPYLLSSASQTVLGIERKGEYVTLNKQDASSHAIYSKLDKLFSKTTDSDTFKGYAKEIPFIAGHKYRFKVEHISGTSSEEAGVYLFIRNTSNTSVVSLAAGDEKDYTWEDTNGTIMLWVAATTVYTDYKFRLSIIDLTLSGNDTENTAPKSVYDTELSTTIASVIEKCDEPCLIFPLVTDIHYVSANTKGYLFDETINNIRYLKDNVRCDGLICLGDLTDGGQGSVQPQTVAAQISFVNLLMDKMNSLGLPVYFSVGNHEDCRYMTTGMTAGQMYAYYMNQAEHNVIPDLSSSALGTNYYKDFDGYKTRLICINTNVLPTNSTKGTYGITQETLTWLEAVLTDMPSDYIGMIITHSPLYDDLEYPDGTTIPNSSEACAIIENCGKTCFAISGHTHFDASLNDGFLNVVVAANKFSTRDTDETLTTDGGETAYLYTRLANDYTADLWDVVILRPVSKKLNFIRFGSGVDREFTLT